MGQQSGSLMSEVLLEDVRQWAGGQRDVRAVGLVGSHARGTATDKSDVDLVIVVDDVVRRLHARSWVADFGDIAHVQHEDWGLVQSLRVYYRDGPEVEFGLAPVAWPTPPLDDGTAAVIRDGLCPLFDPDGLLAAASQTTANDGPDGGT